MWLCRYFGEWPELRLWQISESCLCFSFVEIQCLVALCHFWSRVLSMPWALFMNCTNSSVGLKDCSMSIGWNRNRPLRVLTLKRTWHEPRLLPGIPAQKMPTNRTQHCSFSLCMQICNRGSVNILDMAFSETNIHFLRNKYPKGISNIAVAESNIQKGYNCQKQIANC